MPQAVTTLSEACIHAARHSHALIVDEWINGSLPMYGYFYAQYLFSSTITLVISSLLGSSLGSSSDTEGLETAMEILRRMTDHGNLAAAEFSENLVRVRGVLKNGAGMETGYLYSGGTEDHAKDDGDVYDTSSAVVVSNLPDLPGISTSTAPGPGFTTEMAFLEPTMQDFLGQSGSEMDLVQSEGISIGDVGVGGLETWPVLWTS